MATPTERTIWRTLRYEVRRLWSVVGVLLVSLVALSYAPETARWAIFAYKVSQVSMLWLVAHLLYKATFPYLDLERELRRGGAAALSAAFVRGAAYLAVILGGALLL